LLDCKKGRYLRPFFLILGY